LFYGEVVLEKNTEILQREVDSMLFSKGYLDTLKKIGFSKDFIFYEQIRKMEECINYLLEVIIELDSKEKTNRKQLSRI
jgi:hypothetical protein